MTTENEGHFGLPADESEVEITEVAQQPQPAETPVDPDSVEQPTEEQPTEEQPQQDDQNVFYQKRYQNLTEFLNGEAPDLLNKYRGMGEPGRHTGQPLPPRDESGRFTPKQPEPQQEPEIDFDSDDLYNDPKALLRAQAKMTQQMLEQARRHWREEQEAERQAQMQAQQQQTYATEVQQVQGKYAQMVEGLPPDVVKTAWKNIHGICHDDKQPGGPTRNLMLFAREMKSLMQEKGWAVKQVQAAAQKAQQIKQAQLGAQPSQAQAAQPGNLTDDQKLLQNLYQLQKGAPSEMLKGQG